MINNQKNAKQKQYHHHLGSSGYRTAIPKWQKLEQEILDRGIKPETLHWLERAMYWFFGNWGTVDLETGKVVYGEKLQRVGQRIAYARGLVESGAWQPTREKDELTYALEIAEHVGRTRGYREVSWEHGLPKDRPTYRSRLRKKEEEGERMEEEAERLHRLEAMVMESRETAREVIARKKALEERMNEEIKRQVQMAVSSIQRQTASEPGVNISPPDQLKSSCASTEMPTIQDGMGLHFPMDDITEPLTTC